jgi:hypothetical protein
MGEILHRLAREERGKRAALRAPLLALGRQQAVRQAVRQHASLQPVLFVIAGVFEQHAADGRRVADNRDRGDREPADHDGLFEMRRGPGLERIAGENAQQRKQPERLSARGRHWRYEIIVVGIGSSGMAIRAPHRKSFDRCFNDARGHNTTTRML